MGRTINGPRVKNGKLIRKLAFRFVKANPGKSLVVILSIALCTFLFSALVTVSTSLVEAFRETTERQIGTDADGAFKYLNEEEYGKAASYQGAKEVTKKVFVGNAVNKELYKLYTEVNCFEEGAARHSFCYPETGRMPEKENEIAVSSIVLQAFGMKASGPDDYEKLIGQSLTLEIMGAEESTEHEFEICGIYTGDRVSMAQMVMVSEAFQKKWALTPTSSYYGMGERATVSDAYGRIEACVVFSNPFDIDGQMAEMVMETGLPGNVETGVNWASPLASIDEVTLIMVIAMLVVFFVSGYLIINNVYRINVYTDIRTYGLLKTVGTGDRQIKRLVKWQSIFHCIPGVLIGIIGGILIGAVILPLITDITEISKVGSNGVAVNLWTVLFSALFSVVTVRISIRRAIKIALKVTPMEAVRYSEGNTRGKEKEKKDSSFSPLRFAAINVFREKRRCFFVVLSFALSIAVLMSVFILIYSFDEDKYISQYGCSSFSVADASVDNSSARTRVYDGVPDSFLREINNRQGIVGIGNIYAQSDVIQKLNDRDYARFDERLLQNDRAYTKHRETYIYFDREGPHQLGHGTASKVYGMDEFPLSKLSVLNGTYDAEKFKTGKYIIVNEYGESNYKAESIPYFMPGETIEVNNSDNGRREYEVMATVKIPIAMRIRTYADMDVSYILPSDEFLDFFGERNPMRTLFDTTAEAEAGMDEWLTYYTENMDTSLKYVSKEVYKKEFSGLINMFSAVGILVTVILGLIGLLNLVNTFVTSILTRRVEFAMLEAVGMTKRTQRRIVCMEGMIYGLFSLVTGTALGSLITMLLVKPFTEMVRYGRFEFTVIPVAIVIPFVAAAVLLVPLVIFKRAMRESVIERLRLVNV